MYGSYHSISVAGARILPDCHLHVSVFCPAFFISWIGNMPVVGANPSMFEKSYHLAKPDSLANPAVGANPSNLCVYGVWVGQTLIICSQG